MPVYLLREGQSTIFKIGRTSGDVLDLQGRSKTGKSQTLSLFDFVETSQESACETIFHRQLVSRRVVRGGGWEFFALDSEEHMRRIIADPRKMFAELEEASKAVKEMGVLESNEIPLEPNLEDHQLLERVMKNKEEQAFLKVECELIESKLKRRRGRAAGLRGLATWKTQLTRRYSEELFKSTEPDLYNDLLERYYCLDTTKWKSDDQISTSPSKPLSIRLLSAASLRYTSWIDVPLPLLHNVTSVSTPLRTGPYHARPSTMPRGGRRRNYGSEDIQEFDQGPCAR